MNNITRLPTPAPPSIPRSQEPYHHHRPAHTPLIIDNGSTTFRWGFASFPAPQSGPNVIAKYKERKTNKPLLLFGEGVDLDSGAKAQSRTPWEGDVLLNFDALVSTSFPSCPAVKSNAPGKRTRLCLCQPRNRHPLYRPSCSDDRTSCITPPFALVYVVLSLRPSFI